jgi:hypothetical protein
MLKIFTNTVMQGRNRAIPKRRGKVVHLGGRPAKHYGQPTMFYGLSALDKFQSGPYASRKCVVTLDYTVLVSESWKWFKTSQIFNF